MEECTRMRLIIPARSGNTNLKRHGWQKRWLEAKEKTLSSISGLHFSHNQAGAGSALISHVHAFKTSMALRKGIYLERLSQCLLIMLDKKPWCTLLEKLWAILLMEADCNHSNKKVVGVRTLENAKKCAFVPEEVDSERNKTAHDWTLAKVILLDVVNNQECRQG